MNVLSYFNGASTHLKHWLFIGLLALSTLSIWLCGNPDFRFQSLPDSAHFTELSGNSEKEQWVVKGKPGRVNISEDGIILSLDTPSKLQAHAKRFFDWDADVAAGATHFLITGQLERLSNETSVPLPKERPSFSVHPKDNGKRNGRGVMVRAKGKLQVEDFAELIVPHSGSDQLDIYWSLFLPGEWRLNNLSMHSVQTSSGYYVVMAATLMLLATGLLFVTASFCRHLKLIQVLLLPGLSIFAMISIGIAESTLMRLRAVILEQLPFVHLVEWLQIPMYQVQKSAHVLIFALLTVVAFWVRERIRATCFQLVSCLIILALLTEALQRHSVGRTPRMGDVGLDMIGIAIGIGLCWMSYPAYERLSANRQ